MQLSVYTQNRICSSCMKIQTYMETNSWNMSVAQSVLLRSVLVQQMCKGTNSAVALSRDSGFAIQHVSTFMLTVVKNFSSPTQPALGIMS